MWKRIVPAVIGLLAISSSAEIRINEIHFDPDVKTELVEFIEIYNPDGTAVDLSGWTLSDAVEFTFPPGASIAAGGYQVVSQNTAHFFAKFGKTALGPWAGSLRNSGEEIVLRDQNGVVIDRVEYSLGFPWPTVGEAPGYSIELANPGFDNDLGGNWRRSVPPAPNTGGDVTLISRGSSWKYFKGLSEPSSPIDAWRAAGFNDGSWLTGSMPIGYDGQYPMQTMLSDMNGNYSTVYFRKTFNVADASVFGTLLMNVFYDDGFKIWINGRLVLSRAMPTNEVPYTTIATGSARESGAYDNFVLPPPSEYLVNGQNIITIQGANLLLLNSSDFFVDLDLIGRAGGTTVNTPFARNNSFTNNVAPQLRQVDHSPRQPVAGQPVVITAKATDPEGVASVQILYQAVDPGAYIELTDAAYASTWTTVTMNDAGTDGDEFAGDGVYAATLPGSLQVHRRLMRYRIRATDTTGKSITAPYSDDPEPNFAYFCYNGLPSWSGAISPTSGNTALNQPVTYPADMLGKYPVYHLISKKASVETSTWTEKYGGDLYKWAGTLVYDGKVYDHIHYRARGGVWRYAMGKNMWKFDFNRGHDFQAKDIWGREFDTKWTKLNLGACIQQGDYLHRGEQGMFESVGFRLFNLAGIEGPKTSFAHFRVIDEAAESSASQYTNDFWGLYLALEQEDSRFLDEHNLPDSNFYKMENGTGELNNLGQFGPANKSDLNAFQAGYASTQPEQWWRDNLDLNRYYNYRTIVEAIHHYDIGAGKNYFFFHNDLTGKWSTHPWDLDLTWADNMFGNGAEPFRDRVLPITGLGREYRNRVREIRDLLFNTDQAYQLIDEYAAMIHTPGAPSMVGADRAMWDYHPIMAHPTLVNSSKSGQGRFYQQAASKDFPGMVQIMKNYVVNRANVLDGIAAEAGIPNRPTIANLSPAGNPANRLRFQSSGYSGGSAFAAMQWRIGEITPAGRPAFDPTAPRVYEIEPVWQSAELAAFNNTIDVPSGAARVGKTYRARVKFKDAIGRWSNWSAPIEFVAGEPDNAAALVENLRVSELMFNPQLGSDYEFVELFNGSTNLTLDLSGAKFTSGIDFIFPTNSMLAPLSFCLVTRTPNAAVFRAHYGLQAGAAIYGPYSGSLNNDGEELTLKTTAAGQTIVTFTFGDNHNWPAAADGAGHSLVPVALDIRQDNNDLSYPGNWRASAYIKGSPLAHDVEAPAGSLLNEIMAHTDQSDPSYPEYDSNDWIEILANGSLKTTDCFLSDAAGNLRKWRLPDVASGTLVVFDEVTGFHNPLTNGFGLDKAGEAVFLSYLPEDGVGARVLDAVKFKAQPNTHSLGRIPHGLGSWRMTIPTRGAQNQVAPTSLLISEVMYHPATNVNQTTDNTLDEFVEIYNPTANSIPMFDSVGTWRIDGGISYQFRANTTLAAGGFILLVNFDPGASAALSNSFRVKYSVPDGVRILGPYSGKLGNNSDRVALERPEGPDVVGDAVSWIIVDEVTYAKGSGWPTDANGLGPSLQRIDPAEDGNHVGNWRSAPADAGRIVSVNADRDGDGMPDVWENANGLDPDSSADANLDNDGDGLSNLAEYQLGTDPRDPASGFQIADAEIEVGVLSARVYLVAGKEYVLERASDLNAIQWQIAREIPAPLVTGWADITDPQAASGNNFYRLRLKP